jgi:ABC-type transport system involved in cytochrome c biogenesis permease subunit
MPALGTMYLPAAAAYAAVLLLLALRRRRSALGALLAAFVLHAGFLAARAVALGAPSLHSVFEEQVFLPFCLAAIALWLWGSLRNGEAAAVAVVAAAAALLVLPIDKGVIPPSPKSASWLVPLFFFCEILAHALFLAAAALVCRRGAPALAPAHRLAVWGFVLFSIAQVSGAAWCTLGWSVPFQWSFRHLHSAALWCAYAAYIHLRFLPGWNERRRAAFLAAGALLLAAYLAVLQFSEAGQMRIGG